MCKIHQINIHHILIQFKNRGYYTCSTIQLNIGFYIEKIIDRKARKLRYHPNTTNVKMRTKTVGNIPIICAQLVLL